MSTSTTRILVLLLAYLPLAEAFLISKGVSNAFKLCTARSHVATCRSSSRLRASLRDQIDKVKVQLRRSKKDGDEKEVMRLKKLMATLRAKDPLFSREDQYKIAITSGLFGQAAKLKVAIDEMKLQNPFRAPASESSDAYDLSEDMSWGFDATFHQDPMQDDDTPDDYSDI